MGEALSAAVVELRDAGVGTPALDARLLLQAAADIGPLEVATCASRSLDQGACERFAAFIARRAAREPVGRILGRRGFWTFDILLNDATLEPRPETEVLVEALLDALASRRDEPLSLLDLGTGSGAILLALLSELPRARGLGIDVSPRALDAARENAARAGLSRRACFALADFGDPPREARDLYDCVVANPPYISTGEYEALAPELRHDPRLALDGGLDGLDAYRAISARLPDLLAEDGVVGLEIGRGQRNAVGNILAAAGLSVFSVVPDLAGVDRTVVARPLWTKDLESVEKGGNVFVES